MGAWIYLWAFYFIPLFYISAFVPVPYCLDDCGFVVETEVRQVDSSSSTQPFFVMAFALGDSTYSFLFIKLAMDSQNLT